ncbi:ATP-binding protein [Actinocorallia longicatena]|uniref:Histidine kinase/HSP90-like ATPase domain-containing protein n=1 Tax=Actinocorallia longicatena TaxID=111803 RepID=A0ABP6QR00_9ACTN
MNADPIAAEFTLICPAVPSSAGLARRFLSLLLAEDEFSGFRDAASLVLTELVANALPSAGPVSVTVGLGPGGLVLSVTDTADGHPVPRVPALDEESGRGLLLVGRLATKWDWYPLPNGGKTVFARFDRPLPVS